MLEYENLLVTVPTKSRSETPPLSRVSSEKKQARSEDVARARSMGAYHRFQDLGVHEAVFYGMGRTRRVEHERRGVFHLMKEVVRALHFHPSVLAGHRQSDARSLPSCIEGSLDHHATLAADDDEVLVGAGLQRTGGRRKHRVREFEGSHG